jgi:hypothetical protein
LIDKDRLPAVLSGAFQEEFSMTFCMFAQASDGWVIAAARGALSEIGGMAPIRTAQQVTKILYDKSAEIALCFAGDGCAQRVADDILREVKNGALDLANMQAELQRIANLRFALDEKAVPDNTFNRTALRIVYAMSTRIRKGWHLQIAEDSFAYELGDYGSCYIGDTGNPAVFWTQRYYSAFDIHLRRADALTFLVAHSVIEAGRLNPTGIVGLNVLSYARGKFHWLDEPELDRLRERSKELSTLIEEKLFIIPLDFTRTT